MFRRVQRECIRSSNCAFTPSTTWIWRFSMPAALAGGAEVRASGSEPILQAVSQQPGSAQSTQVSLLPPPWEEFTTRDPFLRATRVSPPG